MPPQGTEKLVHIVLGRTLKARILGVMVQIKQYNKKGLKPDIWQPHRNLTLPNLKPNKTETQLLSAMMPKTSNNLKSICIECSQIKCCKRLLRVLSISGITQRNHEQKYGARAELLYLTSNL